MLTSEEKDYIRSNFLKTVKSGEKRSRIMALASFLSEDEKDADDAYLAVIHHFSNPKNSTEFEKDYKYYLGAGETPYLPENTDKGSK